MGSLTGVVASKSVTEASKGALRTIGNRPQSVMAEGRLTGRQTSRAGRKLEHSDPAFPIKRPVVGASAGCWGFVPSVCLRLLLRVSPAVSSER